MTNLQQIVEDVRKRAGGPAKIAEALGITSQAVSQWDAIPPRWVGPLSSLTGMEPHEIRPDLFAAPKRATQGAAA